MGIVNLVSNLIAETLVKTLLTCIHPASYLLFSLGKNKVLYLVLEGLIHSNLNTISKIVTRAAVARSLWLVIPLPKYIVFFGFSMTLQDCWLEKAGFRFCNESKHSLELHTLTKNPSLVFDFNWLSRIDTLR